MSRRFKNIKYLIKQAKRMGIDVSTDDNIKAFKAYLAGDSDFKRKSVKIGSRAPVSLIPFCVNGYTTKYLDSLSNRALGAIADAGLSQPKLNIDAGTTATADDANKGKKVRGYLAARATVAILDPATVTTPKSQILLLEYKRIASVSYTYPYGKADVAGQRTDLEMRGYIYAEAAKGTKTVSFSPERPA